MTLKHGAVVYHGVIESDGSRRVAKHHYFDVEGGYWRSHKGPHELALDPRFDLREHSPDGFSWGYNGSGPAQLALAILADRFDDATACAFYQDFKREVIARLVDNCGFVIHGDAVDVWMREKIEEATRQRAARTCGFVQV